MHPLLEQHLRLIDTYVQALKDGRAVGPQLFYWHIPMGDPGGYSEHPSSFNRMANLKRARESGMKLTMMADGEGFTLELPT